MRSWLLLLAVLATFQPIVQVASTEDTLSSINHSPLQSSAVNQAANEFLKAIKRNSSAAGEETARISTEVFQVIQSNSSSKHQANTALVESKQNTELIQRTNSEELRTAAYEKTDSDNNNNKNNQNNKNKNSNKEHNSDSVKNNNNKNNNQKNLSDNSDYNNNNNKNNKNNSDRNNLIIEIKNIEEIEGNQIYSSDDLQKSEYKMPEIHKRTQEQLISNDKFANNKLTKNQDNHKNNNEINKIHGNGLVALQSEKNLARTFNLAETTTSASSEHSKEQQQQHKQHNHHKHRQHSPQLASESEELHRNHHHAHHKQHHHRNHHHHQQQQQQQYHAEQQAATSQQQHSSNTLQQATSQDAAPVAAAEKPANAAHTSAQGDIVASSEGGNSSSSTSKNNNKSSSSISHSDISSSFLNSINNNNNNNNNNENNLNNNNNDNNNNNNNDNLEISISLDNSEAIIDEAQDGMPATYSNKEIIGDKIKPDPKILVEIENSLLSLFNMKRPPKIDRSKIVIPDAMKKLYAQVTGHDLDSVNIPRPGLLTKSANTVRSFTHQESKIDDRFPHHHRFRLYFDIKSIPNEEKLKAAELQLSREAISSAALNSREANRTRYQVLVYDITRVGIRGKREPSYLLLDNKTVRLNSTEPVSLDVQPAVNRWLASPKKNFGLLIEVRTMRALKPAPHHHVRLRRSADEAHEEWQHKQPLLFTYTDDGRHKSRSIRDVSSRSKRAREHHKRSHRRKNSDEICRRHSLYVDFADVGWSDWIVAPPGYDAFYCHGKCPFPLADHLNSTNHAVVQTLVNNINPGKVPKACCVPTELEGISMLYLNDQSTVVLKNYQDMTVVGCGCR